MIKKSVFSDKFLFFESFTDISDYSGEWKMIKIKFALLAVSLLESHKSSSWFMAFQPTFDLSESEARRVVVNVNKYYKRIVFLHS